MNSLGKVYPANVEISDVTDIKDEWQELLVDRSYSLEEKPNIQRRQSLQSEMDQDSPHVPRPPRWVDTAAVEMYHLTISKYHYSESHIFSNTI